MITIEQTGGFKKSIKFLDKLSMGRFIPLILNRYGRIGVERLKNVTPIDTGRTASSWYYDVEKKPGGGYDLIFKNSNINKGVPIAVILQYGHGTNEGGYVEGIDYINPAMRAVFTQLVDEIWREVRSS